MQSRSTNLASSSGVGVIGDSAVGTMRSIFRTHGADGVVNFVRELTDAEGVALALRENDAVVCVASCGVAPAVGVEIKESSGLCGQCLATGKVIEHRAEPGQDGTAPWQALTCVPLRHVPHAPGLIVAFGREPDSLRDTTELLALAASVVSAESSRLQAVSESEAAPEPAPVAITEPPVPETVSQPPVPTFAVSATPPLEVPHVSAPIASAAAAPARDSIDELRGMLSSFSPEDALASSFGERARAMLETTRFHLRTSPAAVWIGLAVLAFVVIGVTLAALRSQRAPSQAALAAAMTPAGSTGQPATASTAPAGAADAQPAVSLEVVAAPTARTQSRKSKSAPAEQAEAQPTATAPADDAGRPETTAEASPVPPAPDPTPRKEVAAVQPPPTVFAPHLAAVPSVAVPQPTAPVLARREGVISGRLIRQTQPRYTEELRRIGRGEVELTATIGTDGLVRSVRVVKGNPVLARAAAEAVRNWKYEPFKSNGVPVEAEVPVRVVFGAGH